MDTLFYTKIRKYEQQSYGLIIMPSERHSINDNSCENDSMYHLLREHYDILLSEIKKELLQGRKEIYITWFVRELLPVMEDIFWFTHAVKTLTDDMRAKFTGEIITDSLLPDVSVMMDFCDLGISNYILHVNSSVFFDEQIRAKERKWLNQKANRIINLLSSDLSFNLKLIIQIKSDIPEYTDYNHLLPFINDNRLLLHFAPESPHMCDYALHELNTSGSFRFTIDRIKNSFRDKGFGLVEDYNKELLSAACYAARENRFVIRANGNISKCTVALENEINNIGYMDLNSGKMIINFNVEDIWSYNILSLKCESCDKQLICCNRSCPLWKMNSQNAIRCCN